MIGSRSRSLGLAAALFTAITGLAGAAGAQEEAAAEAERAVPPKADTLAPLRSRVRRIVDEREAIAIAAAQSPTLRAALLSVASARQGIAAEEARWAPTLQADATVTRSSSPRLRANDDYDVFSNQNYVLGTALRKAFPTGTTTELRVEGQRFINSSNTPQTGTSVTQLGSATEGWQASARASVTQPLLRNYGARVGLAELRAARVTRTLAERARDRVASELVRDVLTAYWELWYASQAVEIERAARVLAERQQLEAESRVQAGALADVDVYPFATRLATLDESVLAAEITQNQRGLELAALLALPDASVSVGERGPVTSDAPASLAVVEKALARGSVALSELEQQVETARVRQSVAGEAFRPRLDLAGVVTTQGLSIDVAPAFGRAARFGAVTAQVNAVFELPLDRGRERAEKRRAALAVQSAEASLASSRLTIRSTAARLVASDVAAIRRLELARRTVAIAQKQFEAERERFQLGISLPVQVQQAEDDLRRARLRVIRSQVDQAQGELAIEHLAGELLRRYPEAAAPRRRTRGASSGL